MKYKSHKNIFILLVCFNKPVYSVEKIVRPVVCRLKKTGEIRSCSGETFRLLLLL